MVCTKEMVFGKKLSSWKKPISFSKRLVRPASSDCPKSGTNSRCPFYRGVRQDRVNLLCMYPFSGKFLSKFVLLCQNLSSGTPSQVINFRLLYCFYRIWRTFHLGQRKSWSLRAWRYKGQVRY